MEGKPPPVAMQKGHPLEKRQQSSCYGDGERDQDEAVPDAINGPVQPAGSTHVWKPAQTTGTPQTSLDQSAANSQSQVLVPYSVLSPQSVSRAPMYSAPAFLLPPPGVFKT